MFKNLLIYFIALILFCYPGATSAFCGEESSVILVHDTVVKENEKKRVFFPARAPLSISVLKPKEKAEAYAIKSKNEPGLNQIVQAISPVVFFLPYKPCEQPDQLRIYILEKGDDQKSKETMLAELEVYPITVTLIREDKYEGELLGNPEQPDSMTNLKYTVQPWHEELKPRLALSLLQPTVGDPKVKFKEHAIQSSEGVVTFEILQNSGQGLTSVTALLKRAGGEESWDECARRRIPMLFSAWVTEMPIPFRLGEANPTYLEIPDAIWPDVSQKPATDKLKKGFDRFKAILAKYPEIRNLKDALLDWRLSSAPDFFSDLGKFEKVQESGVLKFVGKMAIPYAPTPLKPIKEIR